MSTKHTDTSLSAETVEHVAALARITLTKEEVSDTINDLSSILGHIDLIRSIDTSGVEPLDHPTELLNRTREDEIAEPLSQQQVLSNAPATRDAYIDVPKVLGGES